MNFCPHRLIYIFVFCFLFSCTIKNKSHNTNNKSKENESNSFIKVELEKLPETPPEEETLVLSGVESVKPDSQQVVSFKIIQIQKPKGFGYDIYIDGKRFLHQPNIPAISGNLSFASRKDAKKVATFVTNKIRKNIMPPSVTLKDLDILGIIY